MFKDTYHKHQTSCVPETYRTSGRQWRQFQGDKKKKKFTSWMRTVEMRTVRTMRCFLKIAQVLQSSAEVLGVSMRNPQVSRHSLPLAKLPFPGCCWGQPTDTTPEHLLDFSLELLQPWMGTGRVTGFARRPRGQGRRHSRSGNWVSCFSYGQDNSYVSNSNISVCSTAQWNGNSHLNRSVQSLLV